MNSRCGGMENVRRGLEDSSCSLLITQALLFKVPDSVHHPLFPLDMVFGQGLKISRWYGASLQGSLQRVFPSLIGASLGSSPFGKFAVEQDSGEARSIHADNVSSPVEDTAKKHGFDAPGNAVRGILSCDAQDQLEATDVDHFQGPYLLAAHHPRFTSIEGC